MLSRQEGEADLAGREGDIRMRDASCEMNCWRGERVIGGNRDTEMPESA